MLAAELQALRRKDASDRAARKARSEEFRAEEKRKQLLAQHSKVATVATVKAQLQDQRAAWTRRMAAERRAHSASLGGPSWTPGPADYADKPSCLTENPGRSIASS